MQDNQKYTDSRFARTLDDADSKNAIAQTGLEHLVLKDFISKSVFAVMDSSIPYKGFYFDELSEHSLKGRDMQGSAFLNNSFSPRNTEMIHFNFELRLKKPQEEMNLIEECIKMFHNNPRIEEIQNLRRTVIDKLEELTMKILEGRRQKGTELSDIISNKKFLDSVLNCFSKENNLSIMSELGNIKKIKQDEIDLINSEFSQVRNLQNFKKESFHSFQ